MKVYKMKEMKKGWFVGNFEPAAYKTGKFEVGYKRHKKGAKWAEHYHKKAVEINYLVRGRMKVRGRELVEGDIFVLEPGERSDPQFLEDCEIVVVKTCSAPGDKYEII